MNDSGLEQRAIEADYLVWRVMETDLPDQREMGKRDEQLAEELGWGDCSGQGMDNG